MQLLSSGLEDGSALQTRMIDAAAHMRLLTMGLLMLIVLRFSPRGLIPER
jgi:branched-chain amino acid transport system permease protein